ncbi:hypothetical protein CBFG_01755 [Clostridiales bacterium 1_7_47FAA]|nr:hypothetical protein CBFG_01755 [Clostridiales bacterium 1_7_47FAA]
MSPENRQKKCKQYMQQQEEEDVWRERYIMKSYMGPRQFLL